MRTLSVLGCSVTAVGLLATIAGAQPASFTDLGSLPQGATATTTPFSVAADIAGTQWFKVTLSADVDSASGRYLDIWTISSSGAAPFPDSEIALFSADGTLLGEDDDDGRNYSSAMSFGDGGACGVRLGTGRADSGFGGATLSFDGRDGATVPAGEYYIAVVSYNFEATFASPFVADSGGDAITGDLKIEYNARSLGVTAAFAPTSVLLGTDSVLEATVAGCSGGAVTGATVDATLPVELGGGTVSLLDNGTAPDAAANDGIYTANVNGSAGGVHAVTISATSGTNSASGAATLTVTLPPPANDECGSAEVVSIPDSNPVVLNGNNSAATGVDLSSCAGAGGKDIWYTFNTGSQGGTWILASCGTGFDTVLSIHTACPTSTTDGTQVACNDDSCGLQSQITPTLAANTDYWVRFSDYNGGSGATTLTITPPPAPPANDDCDTAEEVPVDSALSQTFTVSNLGASAGDPGVIACTGTALANDTWYLFTAPSTDGNNGDWTVNSTGARSVAIYPASSCPVIGDGNADLIACHASGAGASAITGGLVGGQQYLIQVGTTTPLAAGTVTIAFAPYTGVCCISGQPSIDTQSGCALAGGTYSGDNTTIGVGTPTATATNNTAFTFDGLAPVSSELTVSGTGLTLSNVYLQIDIAHTWMADITMQLVNVDTGATATILNEDGNGNDLIGLYTIADTASADWGTGAVAGQIPLGAYRAVNFGAPSSLDAAFSGIAADGTWRLDCDDVFDLADDGFVTSWTLGFNYNSDICNTGPSCNDLDFNNDGNIEPLDVDAYFSILGEGPCLGGTSCDSLDFNNDGNIEPEDVDAYFSVLGEGPCIDN